MLPTKKTIKYVAGQDDTNVDSDDTEGVTCNGKWIILVIVTVFIQTSCDLYKYIYMLSSLSSLLHCSTLKKMSMNFLF